MARVSPCVWGFALTRVGGVKEVLQPRHSRGLLPLLCGQPPCLAAQFRRWQLGQQLGLLVFERRCPWAPEFRFFVSSEGNDSFGKAEACPLGTG